MATTTITKIILERDGEEREAVPVSDAELQKAKPQLEAMGVKFDECQCGAEICFNGYVWRCMVGNNGYCQWFSSSWGCNP